MVGRGRLVLYPRHANRNHPRPHAFATRWQVDVLMDEVMRTHSVEGAASGFVASFEQLVPIISVFQVGNGFGWG